MGQRDYTRADQSDERVSCNALVPLLDAVIQQGRSAESFLAGLPFDEAYIRERGARIGWLDFCLLTERAALVLGGEEGLKAFGRESGWVPGARALFSTVGLFASARQMYKVTTRWALPAMWPMVRSEFEILGPTRLRIRCLLEPGYRSNPGMFYISAGFLETLPALLGQPCSVVDVTMLESGVVLTIDHAPSMTLWARISRLLMGVFAPSRLLEEVRDRDEELGRRLGELSAARRMSRENAALREEFLTNMSHELRTPLNVVMSSTSLLAQTGLTPEQAMLLGDAQSGARSLLTLVEQVLDFSRLQRRRLDLTLSPFEIKALMEEVLTSHSGAAAAAGHTLKMAVDSALPAMAIGDAGRIYQVLDHLLDNAIKFTHEGVICLRASGVSTNGRVALVLAVEDNGPGIDKEGQERLFEPFAQRDGSLRRTAQGMGLGLAICRSLVEMMGGELSVHSSAGEGARFEVSISLSVEETTELMPEQWELTLPTVVAVQAFEEEERAGGRRILLVEDHPVNQRLLGLMVRDMGFEVTYASNGREAVEQFAPGRFDAVLMDCQMPIMDGFEATERIRRQDEEVPIIAVTAHAQVGYADRCRAHGMNAYVPKPVDRALLVSVLDELCGPAIKGLAA